MEERLMKRFRDLEASQAKLREQLGTVMRERGERIMSPSLSSSSSTGRKNMKEVVIIPGYFVRSPYESVLQHIGHAIHVHRPIDGEIIYWNHSAENIYGWKDYEVLGQNVATVLVEEETYPFLEKVMGKISSGQKWSGQFPFKKKSGEVFMAMVTQSPLYDNDELIGIITVSSDSSILYDMNKETPKVWDESNREKRGRKMTFGSVNLHPQLDIVSSVSNLGSKFLPRTHGYSIDEGENSQERCGCPLEMKNEHWEKPKIPSAKVLSKLNIRGSACNLQESKEGIQTRSTKTSV